MHKSSFDKFTTIDFSHKTKSHFPPVGGGITSSPSKVKNSARINVAKNKRKEESLICSNFIYFTLHRLILCLARRSLTTKRRVSWRCVSLIFRSVYLIEGCDVRDEEDEEKAELFILKYLWGNELNMNRKRKMRGGRSHLRRGKWFAALATAHSVIYHVSYKLQKLYTIRYIMRALEKSNKKEVSWIARKLLGISIVIGGKKKKKKLFSTDFSIKRVEEIYFHSRAIFLCRISMAIILTSVSDLFFYFMRAMRDETILPELPN